MLFRPKGAAERLGVAEATLAKWRWAGTGPRYAKVGSKIAYREADLDEWLEGRLRHNTSEGR